VLGAFHTSPPYGGGHGGVRSPSCPPRTTLRSCFSFANYSGLKFRT
jgi:hypothetical protein